MSAERWRPERVFVYRHPVDMRKQIDGLAKSWRELDAQIQAVNWMTELAA